MKNTIVLLVSALLMSVGSLRPFKSVSVTSTSWTSSLFALGQEQIEIYSTLGCKFCRISKAKLQELGLSDFTNIDLDSPPDEADEDRLLFARTSTVPQIYVGEEHVGGCDNLLAELESGEFMKRLEKKGIERAPPTMKKGDDDFQQAALTTQDLRFQNDLGQWILNGNSGGESKYVDASVISESLQRQALLLTDMFASADGMRVAYKKMASSSEFQEYIHLSSCLRDVSLSSLEALPSPVRFSLFTNLYNGLIMHAKCVLGSPDDTPAARNSFFSGESGAAYEIAGLRFSPDDIEHGILRANTRHPYATQDGQPTFWAAGDPRESLRVDNLDPRIHFVLNCGAASCPPIKILGKDPEPALVAATSAYLAGENLRISGGEGTEEFVVTLPKLLFWYSRDFGESDEAVVRTLVRLLEDNSPESASRLQAALKGKVVLEFLDYNWASNSV